MADFDVTPNAFDLDGPDTEIRFATSGFAGGPTLTLTHCGEVQTFARDHITSAHTALGEEVSVILRSEPDRLLETLTLVLPSVLLPDGHDQPMGTFAVITTNQTPHIPPPGAAQQYEVIELSGEARFVRSVTDGDYSAADDATTTGRGVCWKCNGIGGSWETEWVQDFEDGKWVTVAKQVWETCSRCGGTGHD